MASVFPSTADQICAVAMLDVSDCCRQKVPWVLPSLCITSANTGSAESSAVLVPSVGLRKYNWNWIDNSLADAQGGTDPGAGLDQQVTKNQQLLQTATQTLLPVRVMELAQLRPSCFSCPPDQRFHCRLGQNPGPNVIRMPWCQRKPRQIRLAKKAHGVGQNEASYTHANHLRFIGPPIDTVAF